MRLHEQECVQRALGCSAEQMRSVNLSQRLPSAQEIETASAIMIGGSGAFHVYDDEPWIKNIIGFCSELLTQVDRPILGMCFGHQALLLASGAQIVKDADKEELGTFEIHLTQAGKSDELFRGFPDQFFVQLGHVDRAKDLPEGWVNLADSALQPHEAVRLRGQPVWGFQFHAELRMEDNLYRVRHYADHYGAAREEVFELLVAKHRPSPMGTQLMQRFAQVVTEFWENPTCIESPTPSVSF